MRSVVIFPSQTVRAEVHDFEPHVALETTVSISRSYDSDNMYTPGQASLARLMRVLEGQTPSIDVRPNGMHLAYLIPKEATQ